MAIEPLLHPDCFECRGLACRFTVNFVTVDYGATIERFVNEGSVKYEDDFMAGLAFVTEDVFKDAQLLYPRNLLTKLLSDLPSDSFSRGFTKFNSAANGTVEPFVPSRLEPFARRIRPSCLNTHRATTLICPLLAIAANRSR